MSNYKKCTEKMTAEIVQQKLYTRLNASFNKQKLKGGKNNLKKNFL